MDIVLVSMPWAKLAEPSLGLGLLHASLERSGYSVRSRYFNVLLLKFLQQRTYEGLADLLGLNEFLFTGILDSSISIDQTQSLVAHAHAAMTGDTALTGYFDNVAEYVDLFMKLRKTAIPHFVDECVDQLLADQPKVVGFTCLFDQTMASLAVAKRIRQRAPDVKIVLGGYALHGEPGIQVMKANPFVDAVAVGDGEETIVELAQAVLSGCKDLSGVSGLIARVDGHVTTTAVRPRINIESSPYPVFDDYFRDLAEMSKVNNVYVPSNVIPLETSRGCWWGQKNHCTFCGIDDDTMKYRAKSADQALAMLKRANEQYPGRVIRLVDYILPHTYFSGLLERIASELPGLRISCEAKSNMDLLKFNQLHAAGFIAVQPGIESFSTPVLKRIKKGVSGIQNVRTLKLGKRLGIRIDWNILYGFPGDVADEYRNLRSSIPALYHYDPPFNHSPVFLTRFSPMHKAAQKSGNPLRQHPMYDVWFSDDYLRETGFQVSEFCYIFDPRWSYEEDLEEEFAIINAQMRYWKRLAETGEADLTHHLERNHLVVTDSRAGNGARHEKRYPREAADILARCDTDILPIRELVDLQSSQEQVTSLIRQMVDDRVLYREEDLILSLSTNVLGVNKDAFQAGLGGRDLALAHS